MILYQSSHAKYNRLSIEGLQAQPIFDKELELDTLACIVFNSDNYSKIALLDNDDFYSLETQKLFSALKRNYESDKTINLSSVDTEIKSTACYLSIQNNRDYIITAQVDFDIKKLKEISGKRKLQNLLYKATVKIDEGENADNVKAWLLKESKKIITDYAIKEITIPMVDESFAKFMESARDETVRSGFPKFDNVTGGFGKGSMTIIASAPSIGKTTFAINILNHVCGKLGRRVLFVSLEMSYVHLYTKIVTNISGVSFHKIMCGKDKLTDDEWTGITNARAKASEYKLFMIGNKEISLLDIRESLNKVKAEMVIIDYMQLLKPLSNGSLYENTTNLSRGLKVIASEFDVPFLVISSINRDYADRNDMTPRISDIRHSGQIEYDADMVLLLHRDSAMREYDSSKDKSEYIFKHAAELTIAKSRLGESNISIDFFFDGEKAIFREVDSYEPE
jgi:replicative DNA helicase